MAQRGGGHAGRARPARATVGGRLAAVLALAAASLLAVLPTTAGAEPTPAAVLEAPDGPSAISIDNASRASVRAAYRDVLVPALAVPTGWTGSVGSCTPGAPSAAAQDATLTAVNWFRELSQLGPVTFDATASAQAQQAALMMSANGQLSHDPPTSWDCYTAEGDAAAGRSNLALGYSTGAAAIAGYMRDSGSGNTAAGHRRWILHPPKTKLASGTTSNANSLVVFGSGTASGTRPASPLWFPYPTPGYFPAQLEPSGRWSLSRSGADFSAATVSVTRGGTGLPVTIHPVANGYGDNTLVWQVSPGFTMGGADQTYQVTVGNVLVGGVPTSHSYAVTLFDANVDPVTTPPTVTSVLPRAGVTTGGTTVTIDGTGFTGATAVRFGPTAATSFTVVDDTRITAVAPARSAGLVNVWVETSGGTNANQSSSWYTYQAPSTAPPTVTSLTPTIGPVEGGTSVTIVGTGFVDASSVRFGSTAATFQVVNDTTIVATAPPRAASLVNVWVTNGVGTNPNQASSWYSYRAITGPAPTVTAVSPGSGPAAGGQSVTITGTGFTGAASVRFATTEATSFTVVSDTTVVAVAPSRPVGLVSVYVTTQNGRSTSSTASWYRFT